MNQRYQLHREQLKFILRRIEFDVDREEALQELVRGMKEELVSQEDLLSTVERDVIAKDTVYNQVAVRCFEAGLSDVVLPLLQESYMHNNENPDTLYNIGSVLMQFGEYRLAKQYLQQIAPSDSEVEELLTQLRDY